MSPQIQGLMNWWNNEHTTTIRVIGAVPEDQTAFRHHEKSMTAIELAWHIASSEAGVVNYILTGEFGFDSLPKSPATFQDVIKWKEESHEKVVNQIEEVGEAHLIEAVVFFGQEMPRLGILNFLLAHEIHHRGQLSVYVRGAGGLVPSIYGGSADEPMKS